MDTPRVVSIAKQIPGQTWPRELEWIAETFRTSQAHAEVGVFAGRSLYAAAAQMQGATVYAIDAGRYDYDEPGPGWTDAVCETTLRALETINPTLRLNFLRADSVDAARQLAADGVRLDSAFIDGDHSRDGATADIQVFRPLLKAGGIIAGHDYWPADRGVMDAVHNELAGFQIVPHTRLWHWRAPT